MRGMTAPPATRSSHRHSERGSRPCGGPRASAHPRTRARCLRSARTHTSSGTSTVSALFALESWMHACHSRDRYPSLGCEDGEERAAEVEEEDHGREHAHHDQRCWRDGPQRCRDVRGRVAWQQRRVHIDIIVLELLRCTASRVRGATATASRVMMAKGRSASESATRLFASVRRPRSSGVNLEESLVQRWRAETESRPARGLHRRRSA
jgi:hypothetical protein